MLRRSAVRSTATPAKFQLLGTQHVKPRSSGFGRLGKMRSKPGDNVAWYDKGPVEWLPRPVRLSYEHLDKARDWVMRETLDGRYEQINVIR